MRERVAVDRPPPSYEPPPPCYCLTVTTGGEFAFLPAVLCLLTFSSLFLWLLLQRRAVNERRREIQSVAGPAVNLFRLNENQDGHLSSSYLDHGHGTAKRGVLLSNEADQQEFCHRDLYSSRPENTDGPSGSHNDPHCQSPNSSLERHPVSGSPKPVVESGKPFEMPTFHVEELRQTHVAEQAEQLVLKSAAPLKKNMKTPEVPEASTSDETEQAERHLNEPAPLKKKKKGSKHPKAAPRQDVTELAEQYVTEAAYSQYLIETAPLTTEQTEPSYSYAAVKKKKERSKDPRGPTPVVTQQTEQYLRQSIPLETEQVEQHVNKPAHSHTPLKKKKKRSKDRKAPTPDESEESEQYVPESSPLKRTKKRSKDPKAPTLDGTEQAEQHVNVSAHLKDPKAQKQRFSLFGRLW